MSFWLPFLLSTFGLRAIGIPSLSWYPAINFCEGGSSRFFYDVTSFKEGSGNFTVDFVCFIGDYSRGIILVVLLFDWYFGLGKFSLRFLRLGGNLIVFRSF